MIKNYYYNQQLKKYIVQFMAVFAGLQIKVGKMDETEERLVDVPIVYGPRDRVVAWIIGDQTQNKPLRLPTMSANLSDINLAPELRKGIGTERRQAHLKRGGLFPDEIETTYQYMPIPYLATFELSIYTSNTDQKFQILEQLLMLFDPTIQIQTSDDTLDMGMLTTVKLVGINNEQPYPSGAEKRVIVNTLTFEVPVFLSVPNKIRRNFINDIFMRVGAVSQTFDLEDSEAVVDELDRQQVDHELILSIRNVHFD